MVVLMTSGAMSVTVDLFLGVAADLLLPDHYLKFHCVFVHLPSTWPCQKYCHISPLSLAIAVDWEMSLHFFALLPELLCRWRQLHHMLT
ncbi:hypothetical protein F5878DRAFT_634839 [Lentinula raphanica]|uniref:Uncharacterized protein n=1 Tax=Lentinula raphanica TaxID=153919 RepID=A0AA38NXY4_9AGAR|nr:hypothetical protein F5878DRAFT_634839 [Lentinula raphanica]